MITFTLLLSGQTYKVGQNFDFSADNNSIQEILQCVGMLLQTPIGTVVLDRVIGVDYSFIDKPYTVALPMVLAEVPRKIELYEPRIKVEDVKFSALPAESISGKVNCTLTLVLAS